MRKAIQVDGLEVALEADRIEKRNGVLTITF